MPGLVRPGDRAYAMHWLPFSVRHLLPLGKHHWELRAEQERFLQIAQRARKEHPAAVVDETAIPSYTHTNPLIRYLFYERLAVAVEWLDGLPATPSQVMDYGCGLGLLFPALARRGARILGCDIHPELSEAAARSLRVEADILDAAEGLDAVPSGSLDVIFALDVLEHVDDVRSLAAEFRRVLSPGGRVLCSLPTENALYRIGRRLAGFSGAYHLRGPADIIRQLSTCLAMKRIGRLYSFLPLFDFYQGRP